MTVRENKDNYLFKGSDRTYQRLNKAANDATAFNSVKEYT